MQSRSDSTLAIVTRYLLIAAGIAFILYFLFEYRDQAASLIAATNWTWFVIAFGLALLLSWFAAVYLWLQLRQRDVEITLGRTCMIFFASQIAKYIPGRVWGIFFQVNALDMKTASHAVIVANLKLIYLISSSLLVLSVAVIAAFFHILLFPPAMIAGTALAWALLRHGATRLTAILPGSLRLRVANLRSAGGMQEGLEFCLWSLLISITAFISTALFIVAVFGYSAVQVVMLSAYQNVAWVISNLVAIVPAGIGIREGIFVLLSELTNLLDFSAVVLVAIMIRLVQVSVDLALGLIAYVLNLVGERPN